MSAQLEPQITPDAARKCAAYWTNGKVTGRGEWVDSRCPCHDDNSASLGIKWIPGKSGKGALYFMCQAGCDWKNIEAMAVDAGILPKWEPKAPPKDEFAFWKSKGLTPVQGYPYRAANGELRFEKWRLLDEHGEKTFRARRPKDGGGWLASLEDVERPLYRLPEIIQAISEGKNIFIVEGEKDCNNAAKDGLEATCNYEGGGKWSEDYTDIFQNSQSNFLVLDNDHVGYEHLNLVGKSFFDKNIPLRYIELPGIKKHGDFSDYRELLPLEMFLSLVEEAPLWTAPISNPWPKEVKSKPKPPVKEEAPKPQPEPIATPEPEPASNVVPMRSPEFNYISIDAVERWTDAGNGTRLAKRFEGKIFYSPNLGWLYDAGEVFKCDEGVVTEMAKETARAILSETDANGSLIADAATLKKFVTKTLDTPGISKMMKAARTIKSVRCDITEFDADIYSLNTHSGLIDCSTGKVSPRTSKNKCMQITSCKYDEEAFAGLHDWQDIEAILEYMPHWGSCLSIITSEFENMEMLRYIQETGGYWLTGSVKQQEALIVHGPGDNLKSQLLDNFGNMMGSYSHTVRAEMFMNLGGFEKQDDNMSQLLNIRFAPVTELEKNAKMNLAKLKTFTGGKTDKIPARFLGKEPFAYVNKAKIAFRANHLPQIRDTDRGIWRRVKQLDFPNIIPPHMKIKGFEDLVMQDYPAMLAWYMRGCIRQLERGHVLTPNFVEEDTAAYRASMDVFQHFIDECLIESVGSEISGRAMARAHRDFCKDYGYQEISAIKLGLSLREKGIKKREDTSTSHRTVYEGYRLTDDYATERPKSRYSMHD